MSVSYKLFTLHNLISKCNTKMCKLLGMLGGTCWQGGRIRHLFSLLALATADCWFNDSPPSDLTMEKWSLFSMIPQSHQQIDSVLLRKDMCPMYKINRCIGVISGTRRSTVCTNALHQKYWHCSGGIPPWQVFNLTQISLQQNRQINTF